MKKLLKYGLAALLLIFLGYNSVYFRPLDTMTADSTGFDASRFAGEYWKEQVLPSAAQAVPVDSLIQAINTDKAAAFSKYGHALGIGNVRYFMVSGHGTVRSVDGVQLAVQWDENTQPWLIATEYIFGNAVRDASGGIDLNAFENTRDLNEVSAEINELIRKQVVRKEEFKTGDRISFAGAIELNSAHTRLDGVEVIPVVLKKMAP